MTESALPAAEALIDRAAALSDDLRVRSDEIESTRRLPEDLVKRFRDLGLFRMCVPHDLGGSEVDVASMVRIIEEVARGDASAGWCVMIAGTSGVVAAYLPDAEARQIYGPEAAISGGVFAPKGRARREGESYRVTGRWPFASGCQHCTWLMGGAMIDGDGAAPQSRMLLFPAAEATVIDTWDVAGLCGTGSHDIAVEDLEVPAARSVSLTHDRPRATGPLYAFPVFGLLALGIAGVSLGIARRAVDELVGLASAKKPTGSGRRLADRGVTQVEVAQAEATLRAARAFLFDSIGEAWESAATKGAVSAPQRALLRLAATHAATQGARVVDAMYTLGGGSALYRKSPLQRCLRDAHVATQHMMVAGPTYELTGRVLMGLEVDTTML